MRREKNFSNITKEKYNVDQNGRTVKILWTGRKGLKSRLGLWEEIVRKKNLNKIYVMTKRQQWSKRQNYEDFVNLRKKN